MEENIGEKEKSWVEKMADKKLSTSRDGNREI
jgi:hypothetical protein